MMVTENFDEAKAKADELGLRVCGTFKGDKPVYFLMPMEASDDAIHDQAFEVRHGRPINNYERWGIDVAKRLAGQAEQLDLSLS